MKSFDLMPIGSGMSFTIDVDDAKKNLENNYVSLSDILGRIIENRKSNGGINFKLSDGENLFVVDVEKDYYSKNYSVHAYLYDVENEFPAVYDFTTDFKVLSGYNTTKLMVALTEAIIACGKYSDDLEWEKLLAENEFIGNEMFALENTIDENVEKAKAAMDDAKQLIGGMNDVDWWDRDDDELKKCITNYCGDIAEALIGIAQARQNFLKNCSDFTGCNFTLGDAYSDCPVIAFNNYYDELDQFDCTLAFEQILDDIFENGSDEMLDLRDTLYHYLMVA